MPHGLNRDEGEKERSGETHVAHPHSLIIGCTSDSVTQVIH